MSKNNFRYLLVMSIVVLVSLMITLAPSVLAFGNPQETMPAYRPTLTFYYDPTETPKLPVDPNWPTPYPPYEVGPEPYPAPNAVPTGGFYEWLMDLIRTLNMLWSDRPIHVPTSR